MEPQNKPAEAEPLFREALSIYRAALPAGHPDIARGLHNLAGLLRAQNKLAEAEPLFRESLAIRRTALPAGHPFITLSLNHLALLLQTQNKLAEAEPLFREVLEISRASLPAGHPDIIGGMFQLASLLQAQNKLAEAEPLLREALPMCRAAFPAGHPAIVTILRSLADVCESQGKTKEAIALHKEMFESSRAALPRESPELAGQLAALSMTLLTLKAWEEAEPMIREALTIREKVEPDAWTTFNTKSMLGGALLGQKKYADAEPLLLAGYEGLKERGATIPPQGSTRLPEALDRLVQLYTDWHAAEPDKGYDAKATEWQKKLDEHNTAVATQKPATTPGK